MTTAVVVLALALGAAVAIALIQTARVRRALQRARAAEQRGAEAARARDTFFDLATHELRSPLAAILGYQELLEDGAYGTLDESARDPIRRMGRSARHLLHLIDGVVELSRLRAGDVIPDLQPVNTAPLVSGIADAFRAHARDRGIEAEVDIQSVLPTIASDPERLLRALDLLVTSAMKYPDGTTLHLDIVSEHGNDLVVSIHPTELTLRDHADDAELRIGIRLAIAARVAELLGGRLDLDADPGDETIRAIRFRVRSIDPDRDVQRL